MIEGHGILLSARPHDIYNTCTHTIIEYLWAKISRLVKMVLVCFHPVVLQGRNDLR